MKFTYDAFKSFIEKICLVVQFMNCSMNDNTCIRFIEMVRRLRMVKCESYFFLAKKKKDIKLIIVFLISF